MAIPARPAHGCRCESGRKRVCYSDDSRRDFCPDIGYTNLIGAGLALNKVTEMGHSNGYICP